MFEIVKSFGFHEKFNVWLQGMHKNPMSRVKVNGTISRRFPIYKKVQDKEIGFLDIIMKWMNNSVKIKWKTPALS